VIYEATTDGQIISCSRCGRGTLYQFPAVLKNEIRKVRCDRCGQRFSVIGTPMVMLRFLSELPDEEPIKGQA
jgi:uncharacterized protein (DUF983 family)